MKESARDRRTLLVLRMGQENIPVGAIARILRMAPNEVRQVFERALKVGEITFSPPDDWPPPGEPREPPASVPRPHLYALSAQLQIAVGFTASEALVVARLMEDGFSSAEALRETVGSVSLKSLKVLIYHARCKLREGEILTLYGVGYRITPAGRARLKGLIDGVKAA